MLFQNQYTITRWTDWSHLIRAYIDDFFNQYSFYPNILEANSYTHSQFDFLTNINLKERKKVRRNSEPLNLDVLPIKDDSINLSAFISIRGSMDFATNEKLDDKEILLIYDSEPDWDDDTTIIIPPVEEYVTQN